MEYLVTVESDELGLLQAGVKGMKWGVRKKLQYANPKKAIGLHKQAAQIRKKNRKPMSQKTKQKITKGVVLGAVAALTIGSAALSARSKKGSSVVGQWMNPGTYKKPPISVSNLAGAKPTGSSMIKKTMSSIGNTNIGDLKTTGAVADALKNKATVWDF